MLSSRGREMFRDIWKYYKDFFYNDVKFSTYLSEPTFCRHHLSLLRMQLSTIHVFPSMDLDCLSLTAKQLSPPTAERSRSSGLLAEGGIESSVVIWLAWPLSASFSHLPWCTRGDLGQHERTSFPVPFKLQETRDTTVFCNTKVRT